MEELYTVNELSERLKYARSTIYRWLEEGSIPCRRLGRQIRFTENDITAIIAGKINSSNLRFSTAEYKRRQEFYL